MAKVIKNLKVSWQWEGDHYALKGFNVALTSQSDSPYNNTVVSTTVGDVRTHTFHEVVLDDGVQYTAWVQALYEGGDSEWLSCGGIVVQDDGTSTIETVASAESRVEQTNQKIALVVEKVDLQEATLSSLSVEQDQINSTVAKLEKTSPIFSGTASAQATSNKLYDATKNFDVLAQELNIPDLKNLMVRITSGDHIGAIGQIVSHSGNYLTLDDSFTVGNNIDGATYVIEPIAKAAASQFKQTADQIAMRLVVQDEQGNPITGPQVVIGRLKEGPDGKSYIMLQGQSIVLDGDTTVDGSFSLSGDFISGGNITSANYGANAGSQINLIDGTFRFGGYRNPKLSLGGDDKLVLRGTFIQSQSGDTFPVPVFRGAYSPTTPYYQGDVVTHNGSTWIYINATSATGKTPVSGSYWSLYAQKGEQGVQGPQGDQGVQGPKGDKGDAAPPLKAQYSIDGVTNWTDVFFTGQKYMRTSNDNGLTWSTAMKIVGEDGSDGAYVEYQFSKNTSSSTAPTTGWQDAPPVLNVGEYLWMRTRQVDSNGTVGAWSTATRISGDKGDQGPKGDKGDQGPPGANAKLLDLSADSQVFRISKTGVADPTSVILTANLQNTSGTVVWTTSPTITLTGTGNSRTLTSASMGSNNKVTVTATLGDLSDSITIVKVFDGADGAKGDTGSPGADAYTVFLTNESHTFPASPTGVVDSGSFAAGASQVRVFRGSTQFKYSATAANGYYRVISVTPSTGLTLGAYTVVDNQYQVNPSALSSSIDAATVTLEIAARYGGVDTLFTKVISYSKSKTGTTGAKGDKGDPGLPGEKGDPGPGIVYRGTFSSTAKYYNSDKRRDVVTYNAGDGDKYYLYKGPNDASGVWSTSNWEVFGAQFDSVATDILLTKDAAITKKLTIGDATGNGEIVTADGQIWLNRDGLHMKRSASTHKEMQLDTKRLTFYDPITGDVSIALGHTDDVTRQDPNNPEEGNMKYGLLLNQGEIRASEAVLRKSLTIGGVGRAQISDKSITIDHFASNLSVPIPDRFQAFASDGSGNKLVNPSFEMGNFTGWSADYGYSIEYGNARTGDYSAYVSWASSSVYLEQSVPSASGDSWLVNAWVSCLNSSRTYSVVARMYNSSGSAIRSETLGNGGGETTGWYNIVQNRIITSPPGTASVKLEIESSGSGVAWDDITLHRVYKMPTSFDNFYVTIPRDEACEQVKILLRTYGPYLHTPVRVFLNGSLVIELEVPVNSNIVSTDIVLDTRDIDGDININIQGRSYNSSNSSYWVTRMVMQNQRLPIRGAAPVYSVSTGVVSVADRWECLETCEKDCQGTCQSSCQSSCESSCQDACQDACQSTCETTAQGGGCWIGGSLVTVIDPDTQVVSEIPVEDLEHGMMMPYYDVDGDAIKITECISNQRTYTHTIYVAEVEGGYTLEMTREQPLDVLRFDPVAQKQRWYSLPASYLKPGDVLIRPFDKTLHTILSVDVQARPRTWVYNPRTVCGKYIANGFADSSKMLW
jgi:hypothetical protein